jgi:hypothetical protein
MSNFDQNTSQHRNSWGEFGVTEAMKRNWMSISKWALFFSILGFIYVGLSVLMLGSMGTILELLAAMGDENPVLSLFSPFLSYITVVTGIILVVWFFINLYHLKFASQIQRAIKFSDQKAFENAWENLRNHFRIYGILTCVLILLYLVLVVAVVKTAASDFSPMI